MVYLVKYHNEQLTFLGVPILIMSFCEHGVGAEVLQNRMIQTYDLRWIMGTGAQHLLQPVGIPEHQASSLCLQSSPSSLDRGFMRLHVPADGRNVIKVGRGCLCRICVIMGVYREQWGKHRR